MAPKTKAKAPKKAATAVKKTIDKPSKSTATAAAADELASVPKGGVLIEVRTEKNPPSDRTREPGPPPARPLPSSHAHAHITRRCALFTSSSLMARFRWIEVNVDAFE
jgi:hypothetical protein